MHVESVLRTCTTFVAGLIAITCRRRAHPKADNRRCVCYNGVETWYPRIVVAVLLSPSVLGVTSFGFGALLGALGLQFEIAKPNLGNLKG